MKNSRIRKHLQTILPVFIICISNYNTIAQTTSSTGLIEFSIKKGDSELFGLKNSKGDIVLPANFSCIRWVGDYALACHPTAIAGTGLINNQGKLIIDPSKYCDIELYQKGSDVVLFVNGFAKILICKDNGTNLYGFINSSGKEVVPPIYLSVGEFINGAVEVKAVDGKVFKIDGTGKKL